MKSAKVITKAIVGALVLVPLLYVLSIVPAIWAVQHDFLSLRQFYSLYRPISPLAGTSVGGAVDWYASRAMPRVDSCGMGPSTFLQHVQFRAVEAHNADSILIDVVTDTAGTRYFLNTQPKSLTEIEAALREVADTFGSLKDGIVVRAHPSTSFAEVFTLTQRMRQAGARHFEIVLADERATRKANEEEFLVITRETFSRHSLPIFLPDKQPR